MTLEDCRGFVKASRRFSAELPEFGVKILLAGEERDACRGANASGKTEDRRGAATRVHRIAVATDFPYVNATRMQPVPFTSPRDGPGGLN